MTPGDNLDNSARIGLIERAEADGTEEGDSFRFKMLPLRQSNAASNGQIVFR